MADHYYGINLGGGADLSGQAVGAVVDADAVLGGAGVDGHELLGGADDVLRGLGDDDLGADGGPRSGAGEVDDQAVEAVVFDHGASVGSSGLTY